MNDRWKYLGGAALALFIWFNGLFDYLSIVITDPFTRFLVFNAGISLIISLIVKGIIDGRQQQLKKFLLIFLASFLAEIAINIIQPGYHVLKNGMLVVGETLGDSSPDYVVGLLTHNLGFSGAIAYNVVYVVAPLVLIVGAVLIGYDLRKLM